MCTKTIGHGSASDQCYHQSVHTNQNRKSVRLKQLVYFFLCKMLHLFNNEITSVLYNQKVFSPLIVISNWLCFTCTADTNLHWGDTWWRTVHSARKRGAISPIYLCYPAENWCAGMFWFRENTCCFKLDQIYVLLLLGILWKLTQMRERTWYDVLTYIASNQADARTRITMHKRTTSCPDKWPHRWIASPGCYLWNNI